MADPDCLFCKIAGGSIPADVVAETESAMAFRDINPTAPVHVLVIPKRHVESLGAATDGDRELMGEVLLLARDVALQEGIAEAGYRTVLNTGVAGGQSVFHLHAHVIGGRQLTWPAG